ncbi:MAG TPA: hypothetical protein PLP19_22145 [bacterium]|nr:hypothetical protein [bacterium]HPN46202.1 hypothetical protein [bacterium]
MSITEQLPAPNPGEQVNGRYTLIRCHSLYAPAAAPVSPLNVPGVARIEVGPYTPALTRRVFPGSQGAEPVTVGQYYSYSGTLYLQAGYAGAFICGLYNLAWPPQTDNAIAPLCFPDEPVAILEAVCRRADMQGHIYSKIYPDIILKNCIFGSMPEDETVAIPFYSRCAPFLISAGMEMVLDRFIADGETTEYELSAAPLAMPEAGAWTGWDYDNLVYVKIRTEGSGSGVRILQGIEVIDDRLVFDEPPPANAEVSVLYVRATGEPE